MLNVTGAAIEQLNHMLDRTDGAESQGIRLIENGGELRLQLDTPQTGDQVVEAGDRPVLLVDPDLSNALDGATLDAVEGPGGDRQLTLKGPDAGVDDVGADDAPPSNGAH